MNLLLNNLTIAIPTYNRANELNELLSSISDIFSSIRVVISDNASEDGTEDLVKHYQDNSDLDITYIRSESNRGPDQNYFQAVDAVKTEYCILFGSDDKFENGANKILENLILQDIDIVVFRRNLFASNFDNFKKTESFFKDNNIFSFNKLSSNIDDYFNNCISLGGVFSYISSILFKKKIWSDSKVSRDFFGSGYSHVAAIFEGIIKNESVRILASESIIVSCRLGNDFFSSWGILKRYLIDWDGYERLSDVFFPTHKESLLGILSRQMCFKQCLALSFNLKKAGLHDEVKYVDRRLKSSAWGRKVLLRWNISKLIPIKPIELILSIYKK